MTADERVLNFYLSANTPHGFFSRFDGICNPYENVAQYIIKGGSGTGKSSLMKKIAKRAISEGESVELIHCSSDPDSLDGVILKNSGISVVDGTAPHVIEPKYPFAFEKIIDLYRFLDGDKVLKSRDEIIAVARENKQCHERACRFLSAAASILNDNFKTALLYLDKSKLERYIKRLLKRLLPQKDGNVGREQFRFLSAVCERGVVMHVDTAGALCDKVYVFEDNYGAACRIILSAVKKAAVAAGYDVIACYCPLSPYEKLEHLFIPELRLGFMTSNRWHKIELGEIAKRVHCTRFMDMDGLSAKRQRLSFNRRAAGELLAEASRIMGEAKKKHDELEQFYMNAMDFDALSDESEKIISEIIERSAKTVGKKSDTD